MKIARNIWLSVNFLCLAIWLPAQSLHFERLTEDEGVPRNHTQCLLQDKQGFLWIGTTDGLFRYDGRKSLEFRHDPKDSNSLSNNNIKCLMEDREGRIWVGTHTGLNCYLPEKERFVRYFNMGGDQFVGENIIHSVLQDRQGFIWYGTYNGLFRLDAVSGDLMQFLPQIENPNSITHQLTWEIFEDKEGWLWFGTGNGLTVYKNDGTFKFERFLPEPDNPNGLKTDRVWEFVQQPDGTVWMGTNDGFYKVIRKEGKMHFQRFGPDPGNPNSLSHPFIESMFLEGKNRLWVATWNGGLNEVILPEKNGETIQFIHHRHDPNDPNSIGSDLVEKVFRDRSGVLWAGTSAGLNRVAPASRKFETISHIPNNPASLSDNIIKAVLRDQNGNLWVGTRNGLNFLSSDNFEKGHFEFEIFKNQKGNPQSLSHNNIFGLYEDSRGYLWIATYNGLNFIDLAAFRSNPVFRHFTSDDGLPHSFIYDVEEISGGEYWVPTYGQLSKMSFDPARPIETRFQNFDMDTEREDALVNATTYKVCRDRFGHFWIGTFDGLSKYIEKGGREYFENYKNDMDDPASLSNNSIITLFRDRKGRLWVGTRSGLNLVIQKSAEEHVTFRNFGINEGFLNDVIQTVVEDDRGLFWIGTNKGLSLFDPEAALDSRPAVLRNYTHEDGLAGAGIVFRSGHKDQDGYLYFGTASGLNFFKPSELADNPHIPKVVFTDLKILNKSVKPSDEKNALLKKTINMMESITLNYRQNILSIEFAALDYTRPEKNQYAYQLEGFDENWVYIENENSATYTNLPTGTYAFKVRGSNNDGLWNENPTQLTIEVLPPPWRSWWAYCLYAMGIVGMIVAYTRYRIQLKISEMKKKVAVERARFEERETLRKKNAADFHDELGHRLTKISLFLELAERQLENGSPLLQYLSKIKQNASDLSNGIRDLIWTLDPKKDSLFQTLIRIQEFGDKLFDYSDIRFKTKGISEKLDTLKLDPDARKNLLLLFKEAMNNCLKYSEAQRAELEVVMGAATEIQIAFKDDGKGFDPGNTPKGYGLKNMRERAAKLNARLEILSEPRKGTRVEVELRIKSIPVGDS